MSDPIERIRELLSTLPGLPNFWRENCFFLACKLPVEMQIRYLDENLEPLDKYFRDVAEVDGPLRDFCNEFEAHQDFPDEMYLLESFSVPVSILDCSYWFLMIAINSQHDPEQGALYSVCSMATPMLWDMISLEYRGACISVLGNCLNACGFFNQAVGLQENYLSIKPLQQYNQIDWHSLLNSKNALLKLPSEYCRSWYVRCLANALRLTPSRGNAAACAILEGYVGINSSDYNSHSDVIAKLRIAKKKLFLDQDSYVMYMSTLADVLRVLPSRSSNSALVILHECANIPQDVYASFCVMEEFFSGKHLEEYIPEPQNRAIYVTCLSNTLTSLGGRSSQLAANILSSYLGVNAAEQPSVQEIHSRIASRVSSRIDRANMYISLAEAYATVGNPSEMQPAGVLLVHVLCSYVGIIDEDISNSEFMSTYFDTSAMYDVLAEQNICTLYVKSLVLLLLVYRENGVEASRSLLDSYMQHLHENVIARETLEQTPINYIKISAIQCELHNGKDPNALNICRDVVSRILAIRDDQINEDVSRIEFLQNCDSIWPELQRLATERIAYELSEGNEAEADRLERELMLWAEQFKNRLLIERLFTEGTFLGTDGASALEGWSPWRPIPESGTDSGGEQPRSDTLSSELSLLTLRSDLQSEPIVSDSQQPQEDMSRRSRDEMLQSDKTLEELIPLGALYIRVLFDNETPESGLRWWAWRNEVSGVQKIASGISDEGARNILEQAVEEFDQAVKDYEEQAKNECVQTEQKKLELEGQARRERWDNDQREGALKELDEELRLRTEALHVTLQTAFECYTDAMNSQFDLSELVMQGEDVVLHVEGPLLAMPLAWLRGSEGSLWETAESTSVSVSLTLQHVSQQFTESLNKKALFAYPEKPLKKTCVDTALQLGETWERWRLGEDQPEATVSNLRAALNAEHRFGLVFIHAHGDRNAGAILQGNQAWDGRGADLRHTDVLFFACCSTGRLSDKGASEVEGQYARIAEHRGRTVVAARWPVGLEPTEQLSIRFAQAYDRATESGSSTPFAKARAFALARREALRDSSLPSDEAFIAAFEIYGNA